MHDFDNDGELEIISTEFYSLARFSPDGEREKDIVITSHLHSPIITDVNNDGEYDIVISESTNAPEDNYVEALVYNIELERIGQDIDGDGIIEDDELYIMDTSKTALTNFAPVITQLDSDIQKEFIFYSVKSGSFSYLNKQTISAYNIDNDEIISEEEEGGGGWPFNIRNVPYISAILAIKVNDEPYIIAPHKKFDEKWAVSIINSEGFLVDELILENDEITLDTSTSHVLVPSIGDMDEDGNYDIVISWFANDIGGSIMSYKLEGATTENTVLISPTFQNDRANTGFYP